jgi:hypothetical protein
MIRKLPIRELIRMFDFLIAEHELHPAFGERVLLRAQRVHETLQAAD